MLPKPCRRCGRPGKALCDSCKAVVDAKREARRPSRTARGYDALYDRNRRIVVERAWQYGEVCVICGRRFSRPSDITAEHVIPLRSGGTSELHNLGPAHSWCNYSHRRAGSGTAT